MPDEDRRIDALCLGQLPVVGVESGVPDLLLQPKLCLGREYQVGYEFPR